MRILIPLIGLAIFCSNSAFATINSVSIGGVSAQNTVTDATTTTHVVYGGMVLNAGSSTPVCTGATTSDTCDSCIATPTATLGSGLTACNKTSISPTLKMRVVLSTTSTGLSNTAAFAKRDTNSISGAVFTSPGDGTLTADIPWSGLCDTGGLGSCTTSGSATFDMSVGFNISGGTTDAVTIKVNIRILDGAVSTYTECPDANSTGTAGQGYCYFQAYPGDSKIYADLLTHVSDYPATGATGVEYSSLVFFYEKVAANETKLAALARISNKSAIKTQTASATAVDEKISGLNNNETYCLAMANQDQAGNISFFSPIGIATNPETQYCATPSEVIGLLDDKRCFIATAAFGSDMAPEVQSFRDFRDEYLLKNSVGKAFVKFYYKNSPYYAHMIAESEVAKSTVRVVLWPLLFFARMSVSFGLWTTLLILSLASLSIYELFRRLTSRPAVRGEM